MGPVEIILLDLGGVLLRLRNPLATFGIDTSDEAFLEQWLLSPAVRKLERGDLTIEPFAKEMIREFSLPYSPQEFLRCFKRWPDSLFEGVPELLQAVAKSHQLALLSNTNATHWERDDIAGVLEPLIHDVFLSYRTGRVKPEPAAFEDVLTKLEATAERVLFLDDNPLNIDAARQCGMQARLTRGFEDLGQNLRDTGVIH